MLGSHQGADFPKFIIQSSPRLRTYQYGKLLARALLLVLAVVGAIAAGHELGLRVDLHVLLGQPLRRVLHVLGVALVQGVHAGNGNGFLA